MNLHKREVARSQIDTAIDLFLDGKDYLSVITLAGAGEEILGSLIARAGKKRMIDHLIDLDKKLSKGGRQFKIINQEINGFRNSLKHADDPTEDIVDVVEDQEHAIAMLARALTNYHELEGKLSVKMEQFYTWLKQNRSELFDNEENST
ncbi:MAG: hypothetical protein A2Y81_00360 [Nitrospirae bacterium RBG_13_43_8]|nr:MAG: hypothetical protein A2Y81_00360 [Nitrospirae bacterium RBG_13_43_8]